MTVIVYNRWTKLTNFEVFQNKFLTLSITIFKYDEALIEIFLQKNDFFLTFAISAQKKPWISQDSTVKVLSEKMALSHQISQKWQFWAHFLFFNFKSLRKLSAIIFSKFCFYKKLWPFFGFDRNLS